MKRVLISISFFILLLPAISWGQLLQWNTYSNVGTETTEPSVYNDSKISTSNLTQGSITAAANSNRFGGSGWFNTGNNASGNTLAEAIVGNDYIQFVVTPNSGYSFTPTSFVFQWEYSGTGPKNVALRSSIDNYASNIGALEPATSGASNTITISGLTALTTATTFRLFGYGATGTGGTGGFDVSSNTVNVQLNGTTVAVGTPMISCSVSSLTDFGVLAAGSTSSEKSFTVSGSNLTDNIIITAPTDFEVSTTIGSGFGSSVSLTQSSGSVSTTSIYVRFAPSSKGSKSGNITNVSNGATTQNVSVSGKANLATNVVIAEIYAGGGNGSATYTNDYVVLYNPTGSSVDLSAYSIQYAGASSSEYAITNLGGSISSNSYYLIQEYSPTNPDGSHLPVTPNIIGTINFATAGGKVALVNSQTKISGKSDSYVVDFVGYGSANESETSAATSLSNTSSIRRKDNSGGSTYGSNGSGYDSDNNSTDFYEETSLLTNAPLPVELTTFTASTSKQKVNLYWATATEVNNYGFDIERRMGNESWMKIGFVEGSGNSNSPKSYSFTDEPKGGKEFEYRLKQIDIDGAYEYSDVVAAQLENVNTFVLDQNYPNPCNPSTRISYTLPERAGVRLKVYDMLAKEVVELVNSYQEAGRYEVTFDGSNLSSGTYFYKLEAGNFVEVKKLVLVK